MENFAHFYSCFVCLVVSVVPDESDSCIHDHCQSLACSNTIKYVTVFPICICLPTLNILFPQPEHWLPDHLLIHLIFNYIIPSLQVFLFPNRNVAGRRIAKNRTYKVRVDIMAD